MSTRKFPDKLPEYFKHLKPDSLLSTREVAKLFGYKTTASLQTAIYRHSFPKPDKTLLTDHGIKKCYWLVATLCEYILKHNCAE